MAAASSYLASHGEGPGLTIATQAHLGQLLGDVYAKLPSTAAVLPDCLNGLLDRLTDTLSALAKRDEHAFRVEFEAFIPNLYRFAMKLTKSQARADDLVQDTLLRAWRSRDRFAVGTNLGAWLFTIMRNAFYSSARKNLLEVSLGEEDRGEGPATVPDQLDRLDVQDVQRALQALTEPMRRALVLVAIEGMTYEDAATVMNCQIGTVKSRVWRAREQLGFVLGYGASDLGADHITLSAVSGQGTPARA